MFRNPFSFSGRIRRLEYGLTYLFYFITIGLSSLMADITEFLDSLFTLIFFTCYWVLLAQSAKRCHDIGNSGFFQLIPFYIFVIIFQEGESQENKYGIPPKSKEFLEKKESIKFSKFQKPTHLTLLEVIFTVLFASLILSINNIIFLKYDSFLTLSYFLMPIPSFFIFLIISYNNKPLPKKSTYLVNQQLIFALIYYLIIRIYNVIFRSVKIDFEAFILELIAIAFIFGLTYISVGVYSLIFKTPIKNA